MSFINLQHGFKAFGENLILNDASLEIESGECVGLVGVNGCGKSTLLRILCAMEPLDAGTLRAPDAVDSGLLCQDVQNGKTAAGGLDDVPFEDTSAAQKICGLFGLAKGKFSSQDVLSGGESVKLALSALLAREPAALLLDEPTNYLDYEGITTLISLLGALPSTKIIVSHDRYFLDHTVSRILELENGVIRSYTGGYSAYRSAKQRQFDEQMARYEADSKQQRRVQQAIARTKEWAEKSHRQSTLGDDGCAKMGLKEYKRAKTKKLEKKAKSDRKRLEKMVAQGEKRPQEEKTVRFEIQNAKLIGKRILTAQGLSKSFGDLRLFTDSSFAIARGEKVALFGRNGSGKSTLVEIIRGTLAPDSGDITVSPASAPYILTQNFKGLDLRQTPLEYLTQAVGPLTGVHRTALHNMGLPADLITRRMASLSLGERMKVLLAQPILQRCDFIILDEPTSHLDLHARETLERTLDSYDGTLLIISHDLYFLQKLCGKVLLLEDGAIRRLEISFDELLERRGLL